MDAKGMYGTSGVRGGMELRLAGTRHGVPPELLGRNVCVWPPGDGWVLQAPVSESSGQCRECGAGSSGEGAGEGLGWSIGTSLPLVFLLAGVDTESGPPQLLVPTGRVLVVLQKGA